VFPEVATAQRFSLHQCSKSAQTYIPVELYHTVIRKKTKNRSALLPALAAGLPRQDRVYITTDELFRFHNDEFDELPCKLDSTENPRSFEKYSTPS